MTHSITATSNSTSEGLPPPLPEPATEYLRFDVIMGALADPLRLTILGKLLLESEAYDHSCGWFGFDRLKSSLTHHFKALREAGLIRQRQYGLERRSRVRMEELDERFPGLLDGVVPVTFFVTSSKNPILRHAAINERAAAPSNMALNAVSPNT